MNHAATSLPTPPLKPTVRTRFAPSPTGYLHVGGIRTALFAFLVARQAGGKFVLRLEDTDKKREVQGSAQHVIDSLTSLGLQYDEGPDIGGPYAPYTQSDRLDSYHRWAQRLIEAGRAYADPYSPDALQALRDTAQAEKRPFLYRNHRPDNPPEWDGTQPLRFRSEPKEYHWHDAVMGDMIARPENIDDFVLIKRDGYPTYDFAHIVDDAEMHITHVIRGQEFISSMPKYLNLYEALGFNMSPTVTSASRPVSDETSAQARELPAAGPMRGEVSLVATSPADAKGAAADSSRRAEAVSEDSGRDTDAVVPVMSHLPHILNEQGNKKLGKRDGAKDVLDYLRDGYLPEALVSFIATMGWNDGTEQEVFTMSELVEKFSLERVQRSGARFDEKRLLWMNGYFIRQLSLDELARRITHFWPSCAADQPEHYKTQVLGLAHDRLKTLNDLPGLTSYFFEEPSENWSLITENKQLGKLERGEISRIVQAAHDALESLDDWSSETIQSTLNDLLAQLQLKPAIVFGLIRIAVTWAPFSPQLPDTLALLGQQKTLDRLAKCT